MKTKEDFNTMPPTQENYTTIVPTQKDENKKLMVLKKITPGENNLMTTPGNFVMTPSQENATGNPKDEKL